MLKRSFLLQTIWRRIYMCLLKWLLWIKLSNTSKLLFVERMQKWCYVQFFSWFIFLHMPLWSDWYILWYSNWYLSIKSMFKRRHLLTKQLKQLHMYLSIRIYWTILQHKNWSMFIESLFKWCHLYSAKLWL